MSEHEIPITEQGLHDFIRFAYKEIKRGDQKIKKLNELIDICRTQLIIKGQGTQLPERKEQNAEHLQVV